MARDATLEEIGEQCRAELANGVENPEELDEYATALWVRMRALAPSNDTALGLAGFAVQVSPPERIGTVLKLTIKDVEWLDAKTVALFYEAISTVFVQKSASAIKRLFALTHEFAHARLPHRSHAEVVYLGLAILLPRHLVDDLHDKHVGSAALARRCTWPVPAWAFDLRGQLLREQRAKSA
jgi:hypothetical protein